MSRKSNGRIEAWLVDEECKLFPLYIIVSMDCFILVCNIKTNEQKQLLQCSYHVLVFGGGNKT